LLIKELPVEFGEDVVFHSTVTLKEDGKLKKGENLLIW
jgi:hypothetical protein